MKSALVPLILGLAFIAGAVVTNVQQREVQRADMRDIAGLRAELDSVHIALARASSGADSARLAKSVADRTYILGRREFHVPSRQEAIDGWWNLRGPGTLLCVVGALFIALAVATPLLRRIAAR